MNPEIRLAFDDAFAGSIPSSGTLGLDRARGPARDIRGCLSIARRAGIGGARAARMGSEKRVAPACSKPGAPRRWNDPAIGPSLSGPGDAQIGARLGGPETQ